MARWLWLLPVVGAVALAGWLGQDQPVIEAHSESESVKASPVSRGTASTPGEAVQLRVSVLARYPHDPTAFTQGLLWHDGKLYETTGLYGRSRLRRWDLETGEIERETRLQDDLFGEGLALVGPRERNQLIWLTWKAGRALRFDPESFARLGESSYEGDGWGLTLCNGELYRSDGTSTLWRHDAVTFAVRARFQVSREGHSIELLNELECTPRGILANILGLDEIVRIDPLSGRVTATVDASGLLSPEERDVEAVLNGIAYRPETDTLLLTGKNWPWLFEVVLEEGGDAL